MSQWLHEGLDALAAADCAAVERRLAGPAERCDRADWEHLAGSLALARSDLPFAVKHFQTALHLRPDFAVAHHALGAALRASGQLETARASFERAAELEPEYVDALLGQGETSLELGDHEQARDCFEIALAHAPDDVRALHGMARLLRAANAIEKSIACLQRALRMAPNNADLHFELGLSTNRAGDTQAALDSYRRAAELDPEQHAAMVNLGLIHLAQLGDAANAQQWFERAIRLCPDSVAAQANLGIALQEQGQFSAALAHYERLIAAHPEVIEYRWNRAIAHLYQGDFERGWADYELRHTRGGRDVRRRFPLPEWGGGDLGGRHILVYGEQGLGDEIMFASCVPDLLRLAGGVVLECDGRLAGLFQRSFPAAAVQGAPRDAERGWLRAHPQLDRQSAIGSLPRFLRRRAADFPQHHGYLVADPARVAEWKSRLSERNGKLNVGLSWRGGTLKTREAIRSLTFDQCSPWLKSRSCQFVCMQRGDCADAVAAAQGLGAGLAWWPQALQDTDELAALIDALDLVISVDNTIVHLAGALGQRCWVLLSHAPDWRYGWRGERMPWYPSVKLLRQTRPGDWLPVIESVTAGLGRLERR